MLRLPVSDTVLILLKRITYGSSNPAESGDILCDCCLYLMAAAEHIKQYTGSAIAVRDYSVLSELNTPRHIVELLLVLNWYTIPILNTIILNDYAVTKIEISCQNEVILTPLE